MESVTLTVQALDIINDVLNTITGYGSERKVNFSVGLTEYGADIKFILTYNDHETKIFEGLIKQDKLINAIKNEDKKEKINEKEIQIKN